MNIELIKVELKKPLLVIIILTMTGYSFTLKGGVARSYQTNSAKIASDILVVRLIDPSGQPVKGAKVASWANWSDTRPAPQRAQMRFIRRKINIVSQEDGTVALDAELLFGNLPENRAIPLYVYHEDRKIGCLISLLRKDLGRRIVVKLQSVCHVKGQLRSSGLQELGLPLKWTNVYVYWEDLRPFKCGSEQQRFQFYLPPGRYRLDAYGTHTYHNKVSIDVKPRQRELELDIDLPVDKLSTLFHKPAPELRQIKGWKNGEPTTLKHLRGKVVLLDFWGYWCSPCIRAMPGLMQLHDEYSEKGLVIIAVHDDTVVSIAEMDSKLAVIREKYWRGRHLPFLVALDGGGETPIKGTDKSAPGATTAAYGITSFPTTVVIDREGIVREFSLRGPESKRELEKILGLLDEPNGNLVKRFEAAYCLEQSRFLKRIPPSLVVLWRKFLNQTNSVDNYYTMFFWDEKLITSGRRPIFKEGVSLKDVFERIIGLSKFDYNIADDVLRIQIPGDWIVRKGSSKEQQLKDFEQVVREYTDRRIRFQKHRIERDAIVARGKFHFKPLSGTYDDTRIHVFSDKLDPDERGGGSSASLLDRFLTQRLAVTQLNQQVINLTEWSDDVVHSFGTHMSAHLGRLPQGAEKDAKIGLLLKNLAQQTSLTFTRERRKIDVWYVVDDNRSRGDF